VPVRNLFATRLYEGSLNDPDFVAELENSCRVLGEDDRAGRAWSKAHGYRGYTSYASLDDLPQRDPVIGELARRLNKHVAAFAEDCAFDLERKLKLDSLWVNILKPGGTHSGHIHPHSVVSGTVSGALKFEDPRLAMMMAAPTRRDDAPEDLRSFIYAQPVTGSVLLWESWLRHEVVPNTAKEERISISFNYR
jgi:uncharacterized protein (TIGR02466 family)